jgi:hypothetical protein
MKAPPQVSRKLQAKFLMEVLQKDGRVHRVRCAQTIFCICFHKRERKARPAVRVPHERSPEGGNRAQYVIDWNIRLSRLFGLPFGSLGIFADALNVNSAGQKFQELDLSGPSFNLRLPAVIQTPRFVRIGFRYDF